MSAGDDPLRVGVLTVSDRLSRHPREGEDESGATIVRWCEERGFAVARQEIVPDGTASVVPVLLDWSDSGDLDLIVTTGGTGFTPRDRTPEATRAVSERLALGLAEQLRRGGLEETPFAALSRGEVGIRGSCVIVNLPGSPQGVRDGLGSLTRVVAHAARLSAGRRDSHRSGDREGAAG